MCTEKLRVLFSKANISSEKVLAYASSIGDLDMNPVQGAHPRACPRRRNREIVVRTRAIRMPVNRWVSFMDK